MMGREKSERAAVEWGENAAAVVVSSRGGETRLLLGGEGMRAYCMCGMVIFHLKIKDEKFKAIVIYNFKNKKVRFQNQNQK